VLRRPAAKDFITALISYFFGGASAADDPANTLRPSGSLMRPSQTS
jgi:hypothetical protein